MVPARVRAPTVDDMAQLRLVGIGRLALWAHVPSTQGTHYGYARSRLPLRVVCKSKLVDQIR